MAIELPLFPLNVVLFPGTELPLHIFEPRYRQMINECYERRSPFGVVLARSKSEHLYDEPYQIGTMAEIESLERLEDGRINLVARGGQRFRILSQQRTKPYLSGLVELYSDMSEAGEQLERVVQQARLLFRAYLETLLAVIGQDELEFILPGGAEELSHFIAHLMDIHDEQKQHMLELTSTSQRLEEEVVILRREVPFIREVLSMNQRFQADMPDHSMLN
ncbi:MAG TPA: LON peptidase substrate-binding domain-containing protein [Ktedonobacteraceae bacterium]|jgi:Lon protease-like protein